MTRIGLMHAQQAAEKSMKGALIAVNRKFPKTHDLDALMNVCTAVLPEVAQRAAPLTQLSVYYLQLRYPSPNLAITEDDAVALVERTAELLACARRVTGA